MHIVYTEDGRFSTRSHVAAQKKLSAAAHNKLQSILDYVSYTCRASLEDLDLPESLQGVVFHDHFCEDTIERLYYSAGYEDICIFFENTKRHMPHSSH